jgi:hypothetical protein
VSNSLNQLTSNSVTLTVISAPTITRQPTSTRIVAGQTATLEVIASGSAATYQWHSSAGPLAGQTQSTYSTSTPGSYYVVVANRAGTVTSETATVSVIAAPTIVTQPASATVPQGGTHTFTVVASGEGLRYQWRNAAGDIAGANAASYVAREAGVYRVIVSNEAGSTPSNEATLSFEAPPTPLPTITQPQSATIDEGGSHTFTVVATGTDLRYQWRNAAGPIAGAVLTSYTTGTAGSYSVTVTSGANGPSVTSSAATLTVRPAPPSAPTITTQPLSATIDEGGRHTFTVVANGTDLRYQWRNAAGPIAGAVAASYLTGTAGTYTVTVTSGANGPAVTSAAATLTVRPPPTPAPTITTQPQSEAIAFNTTHTFSVVASGTGLRYQWANAAGPIANATEPRYTTGFPGTYTVTVRNDGGERTSASATLSVRPPSITPSTASITAQQPATLSVSVAGVNVRYQWMLNNEPLRDGTQSTYLARTPGSYRVMVTGAFGSATSEPAVVTAIALPVIVTQPVSVNAVVGGSGTFTVVATGTGLSYRWDVETVGAGFRPVPNETTATLTTSTAGTYRVVVSNAAGPVSSNSVTLQIAPSIVRQSNNFTITAGQVATLFVEAQGAPLNYEWQRGEIDPTNLRLAYRWVPIAGATSRTMPTERAGIYRVVVSNRAGSVASEPMIVIVNAPPVITRGP